MAQIETFRLPTGQEYALFEYVERLKRHHAGRIAVHIGLSRLQPQNQREQYIRLALTMFDDLAAQQEGQTFLLRNNDIIFIGSADNVKPIEDAVIKLRYMFSEDALIRYSDGAGKSNFCTWYVLEREYQPFLDLCRRLRLMTKTDVPDLGTGTVSKAPLDSKNLAKLEEALIGADLSNLIRNQPICAIGETRLAVIAFHEIYCSIADLELTLTPDIRISGNPLLFQYLTLTLDKRILAHLSREWKHDRGYSINLNVATLLSPEFMKFDQQTPIGARGRLIIELQKVDIYADLNAFFFAREYAHHRGYRLCLDSMTHLTLPYVDREKLGLDMVKLLWSPELADAGNAAMLDELRTQVAQIGPRRMILAHCDCEEAIDVGLSLGIDLFQGRHIAKMCQLLPSQSSARSIAKRPIRA